MPVRRFNFTRRARITHADVDIRIFGDGGAHPRFEAALALGAYRLPSDAPVHLEARRRTTVKRFSFGTVEDVRPPEDCSLAVFEDAAGVVFRVVVTSPSPPHALILAEAERIVPRADMGRGERLSLLPAKGDASLGQTPWKIDFNNGPLLLVNSCGIEWKTLVRQPTFQALVYPMALRTVLGRVFADGGAEPGATGDWKGQWLEFARTLLPSEDIPELDNSEQVDEWIDRVVDALCEQLQLADKLAAHFTDEG